MARLNITNSIFQHDTPININEPTTSLTTPSTSTFKFREITGRYSTSNVRLGAVTNRSLSEKLDSKTIYLTHIPSIPIEPNDIVQVVNSRNVIERWVVLDFERTFVKKDSPQLYDYTINLMSPVKLLENIIMPNTSITNIGQNRTVAFYIKNAFKQYFKNKYNLINSIGDSIYEIFTNIAPECTFNEPTLREYLDFLMQTKGYICNLEMTNASFILTTFDLNKKLDESFPTQYCDTMIQSQSASDYVTELDTSCKDIVSSTSITEYHKLKSTEYAFDSNTSKIYTDHKIYDLEELKVISLGVENNNAFVRFEKQSQRKEDIYDMSWGTMTFLKDGDTYRYDDTYPCCNPTSLRLFGSNTKPSNTYTGGANIINISMSQTDIANYVVSEPIYSSLPIKPQGYFKDSKFAMSEKAKNNTIFWSKASNVIDGLHLFEKNNVLGFEVSDEPSIEYATISAWFKNNKKPLGLKRYTYNVNGNSSSINVFNFNCYSVYEFYYAGNTYAVVVNLANLESHFDSTKLYDWKNVKFAIKYKPYIDIKIAQRQPEYRHLVAQTNNSTNALTDVIEFYKQTVEKNNQLGNATISFYGNSDSINTFKLGQQYEADDGTYILNELEYTEKLNLVTFKGTLTKNYSNRNINTLLNREKRYYALPSANESVLRQEFIYYKGNISSYVLNDANPFVVLVGYDEETNEEYFIGSLPCSKQVLSDKVTAFTFTMYDNVALAYRTSNNMIDGTEIYESEFLEYTNEDGECSYLKMTLTTNSGWGNNSAYNYEYVGSTQTSYRVTFELGAKTNSTWLKDSREQLSVTIIVEHS